MGIFLDPSGSVSATAECRESSKGSGEGRKKGGTWRE